MTNAAKQLIDSFEALPEQDKHEVLGQLLRRLMEKPYGSPSDEELPRAHVHSPRLAHHEQAADFAKQIVQVADDAEL